MARTTKPRGAKPSSAKRQLSFPIVGIGASAGGLEALRALFSAMPTDTGMGFVVVVHLAPTHASSLVELLQSHTGMPVCEIEDGTAVAPNHVYVIPPNRELAILHGRLQLLETTRPRGAKLPIDAFFRSLAQDQESRAICVILSGTGTDGTLGAKAVKGAVGMVMVQDEASAAYDGMPRSALSTGLVDYVLPPEEMPAQLLKYARYAGDSLRRQAVPTKSFPLALHKVFAVLRAQTDHDFSLYKQTTILRRIERRMAVHQIEDITDYVRLLQQSESEAGDLFKELLIGVTSFFRDPEAFHLLQTEALPRLLEGRSPDHPVRVWVPGCSTGEEAYSLAIALHECIEQLDHHHHVQIFATDIDEDAIAVARAGAYPESIAADVSSARLRRFFAKEEGGTYRVKKTIRETLVFATQDINKDPPFTKLDLLSCRNLLIYLGAELQQRLLPIFHYSLRPDGVLFLGSSETIGQARDLFSCSHKKWKIFRRQTGPLSSPGRMEFPTMARADELTPRPDGVVKKAENLSVLQLVEAILRQSNTPPCAVVDESSNVIYIHGRTGRYLEPAEGRASVNIVTMARPGLRKKLAGAIRQAAITTQEVTHRGLQVATNGQKLKVDLTVRPVLNQPWARGLLLVVFDEVAASSKATRQPTTTARTRRRGKSAAALEQELQDTREDLQTTIEELEASNEELSSTNEELQSTNEELQSTNEELETSKEELQSLNEESATVNVELQAHIDELCKTNDDLKNLLDSTEIAALFLDSELRIRRYTPRITELFPLAPVDVTRPISHLASSLLEIDVAAISALVLDDLVVREVEVVSRDGQQYVMRVRPYRTVANVIDGVVLTFECVTEARRLLDATRRAEQMLKAAIRASPFGLIVAHVDTEARYTWIYSPREGFDGAKLVGRRDDEIADTQGALDLRALKQQVIAGGGAAEGEFTLPLAGVERRYRVAVEPLLDAKGDLVGATSTAIEIEE